MLTDINDLVNEGRVRDALSGLTSHPRSEEGDENYSRAINMMTGTLNDIERNEIEGTESPESLQRAKAKMRRSILSFSQMHNITHVEAPPAKVRLPMDTVPDPALQTTPADKPCILFLASDPRGMGELKLHEEFVKIRTHLDDKTDNFRLELKFEQRPDTLTKTILDERPAYVHFAGHGVGASDEFNPAGIVLEDRERNPKIVTGTALANMFRLLKKRFAIKAVVLNACESTEQARAISTNGIYTIGMAEEIPDPAAISFAGGFYLGLAESPDDIPFAYEMAVNSLLMEGFEQAQIPKLFLDGKEVTF
ncbi:CHAT domain-containing protein [Neolewinella aurantiaca]|uniref:CHAT domain-containing protein n=1 Tax=Neolewinella aurantiaca TaxID=2602767 RepID=A0A5C7FYG3_9BACT|nr:CHAT domain-containing protein [Neolewinella aurantiaca]TXF91626.1 CHAT domain-containing protein [Neolewinella aurantiaca]